MEAVWLVIQDWRFCGTTLLFGALIGQIVFKKTPPPRGFAVHFERFVRAGVAGAAAKSAGAKPFEFMANAVGAHAAAALNAALTRQRRQFLTMGLLVAALLLIPLFLYARAATVVPDWAFGAIAALGVYRTWRLW
jgi:hypothetical protein